MTEPGARLLFLLPFPPRLDADHGGARVIAELLHHLPARYELAALYMRGPADMPPDRATRDRCALLIEAARAATARGPIGPLTRAARRLGGLVRAPPTWVSRWSVPGVEAHLRELAEEWRPDLVQAEFSVMGQYLGGPGACAVPRVITFHEPGVVAAEDAWRRSRGPARALAALELRAWRRFERRVLGAVDAAVTFTDGDRERLAALTQASGGPKLVSIPLGISMPARPPSRSRTATSIILFFGNFNHPPNADAAMRLADAILPQIRADVPQAELRLIGSNPTRAMLRTRRPGVRVLGYAEDLGPHLAEAAVVVAPLRMGGGMRVKVLEALAYGKAVVASRLATAGLALENGKHVLLAETDREFAAAIAALLRDERSAAALGSAARAWAEHNAGWDSTVRRYVALYGELLKR